ncbi:MAG TPA: substrate-binding domain-containing protein [Fimbriimonadaceae bacterium]|nr:substrate-binding domain-containing protein [Fimbriimonadaceae bacterium]
MRFGAQLLFIVPLAIAIAACSGDKSGATNSAGGGKAGESTEKPLVYFSQANSADPWRQVFDAETKEAADKQSNLFTFEETTAGDDPNRQIEQIETELLKNPKVMLVSPATIAVQKAVEEAHDKGVFVVVLDRNLEGNKWDVYVGGDNRTIGHAAGEYMGKKLNGKGIVLMIQGIADAPPTKDRAAGFMDAMRDFPGIKVIAGDNCDYQRQKAETYMENFLQRHQPFDAVYAHNDEMAIGAYMAMNAAHTPKKVIVGIDGCQKEVVQMIKDGKLDATFSYPDPGPKGIQIAAEAVNGKMPTSKKVLLPTVMITKETADAYSQQHPNLH